jgi:hypothetical protein
MLFAAMTVILCIAGFESGMRSHDWPPTVVSGWRTTRPGGPVNQLGWRGQPWRQRQPADFVVVITGPSECTECAPEDTLDQVLERELLRFNPNAHVVNLGSRGYSQDQEFLALHEYFIHERADLVITWSSIARDVPANTFRGIRINASETRLKPTFVFRNNDIRGPTEAIGQAVYDFKLTTLWRPLFSNPDRAWARSLPAASPGADTAPPGIATQLHVNDALEEQRTPWSIWLTPRPERVTYGVDLTRSLFRHMRDLAALHGARFIVLRMPEPAEPRTDAPVALEHEGHWFVADPAARDAAISQITEGVETIALPPEAEQPTSSDSDRQTMARIAEALNEHNLVNPAAWSRLHR